MRYKKSVVALSLLGLSALALSAQAQSGDPLYITVDENGQGTALAPLSSRITYPFLGTLQADPGPGGLASALTYSLGLAVPGDVFLQDPGGNILDVIRFNPASLVFYSDDAGVKDALADTSSPPTAFYSNTAVVQEVGAEGNNGTFYTPTANQPGGMLFFSVTYQFISDAAVPEPGSLALLVGMGLSGAGFLARRRKQSRQAVQVSRAA